MNASRKMLGNSVVDGRRSGSIPRRRWHRILLASTAVLSLGAQDAAWAVCSDGTTFPVGGFVTSSAQLPIGSNWSPNFFTAANGSLFIPDTSVNEHNDPTQPLTGGGHNWVFDQGSTLCKQTDTGGPGAVATGWTIPLNSNADCVLLGIFQGSLLVGFGDIPLRGEAITPTCDPALLSTATVPNPANTNFNQLGCSIYHGLKTDAQHAITFLLVASGKGTLISVSLDPVINPTVGGEAGKTVGPQSIYSGIPDGQQLTNVTVSNDGQFVIATSKAAVSGMHCTVSDRGMA
jgi:hypothetical protein